MVKFLEWWGYDVKSPDKMQDLELNIVEGLLMCGYIGLSFINILQSAPSILGLAINTVILCRIIVKNMIEQRRLAKSGTTTGHRFTLVHILKIAVEIVVIIMLTLVSVWAIITTGDLSVVKFFMGIVLAVTFIEDIGSLLERLYEAEPKLIEG